MTVAARTPVTSSASPSPSSLWAWASSSSPKRPHPPPFAQQPHPPPATLETACCPCPSAWAYAWTTTPAGSTFMTLTPCDAFMRGRWIVLEPCIQRLLSWGAAKFSWRSLSPPRSWLSEEGEREGPVGWGGGGMRLRGSESGHIHGQRSSEAGRWCDDTGLILFIAKVSVSGYCLSLDLNCLLPSAVESAEVPLQPPLVTSIMEDLSVPLFHIHGDS